MWQSLVIAAALLSAEPNEEQAGLLKTFREEFVAIQPGAEGFPKSFTMGRQGGVKAEAPPHRVEMKRPFHMARYEVPQNLWEAVMGANPSRWKGPRNSVEMLSHSEAVDFCGRATSLMRDAELIAKNQIIRLPSEAEWEYAARAGSETLYSFGDDVQELDAYAWHTGNAAGNDPPVGAKKPNPWGLHDMHGYLWEWCADSWHDDYQRAPADGRAWIDDGQPKQYVLRGGSWKDAAEKLTSSYRQPAAASHQDDAVGLRCALAEEENAD